MINRFYDIINKLYVIINRFYIIINNLYIMVNNLFKKKTIFLLIVLKTGTKLNEKFKNRVFLYKVLFFLDRPN